MEIILAATAPRACNEMTAMKFLQFSLLRLLIGVTIVCFAAAIGVNFPRPFVEIGLQLVKLVPALVIAFVLRALASHKRLVLGSALVGAALGAILVPLPTGLPESWLDQQIREVECAVPSVAVGASLLGGLALLVELVNRPRTRRATASHKPDRPEAYPTTRQVGEP